MITEVMQGDVQSIRALRLALQSRPLRNDCASATIRAAVSTSGNTAKNRRLFGCCAAMPSSESCWD